MGTDKVTKMAVGVGAIAGMRSMAAPALLGEYLRNQPNKKFQNAFFDFISSTVFTRTSESLAAGEMVADKSKYVPDRISAGALTGRVALGAFAGAVIYMFNKRSFLKGAVIGGGAAAMSTYVSYYLRKAVDENTGISDTYLGLVEDAVVLGSSTALLNSDK